MNYLKKYKVLFCAAILCVSLEAVCDLLLPKIMADIINIAVKQGNANQTLRPGFFMFGVIFLGAIFAATRNILASHVSQKFGHDLRVDTFKKIMHFSIVSADKLENGSLITRMTNDTSQVVLFINGIMRIFLKAPITCVGSIVMAVSLSLKLSGTLFIAVFIVSVLIYFSIKMSYVRFSKVQVAVDKMNTFLEEYLLGVRLVKAFGRFEDEKDKFSETNTDLTNKSIASQMPMVFFAPLISLVISLGTAVILYTGSRLFKTGDIDVGTITAFTTYMTQILGSLVMITNVFNIFVRAKASRERIEEVLRAEEDFFSHEGQSFENGNIAFENVTFSYPAGSGLPTLKNLSFEIEKGKSLAIIGPTGAGKTTIAWLLLHFYKVNEGDIKINGVSVDKIKVKELRENIALAPQQSMLFTGTISENIKFSDSNAPDDAVMQASKIAQADGFISKTMDQYHSFLGRSGVNISGGQKQRISIARALLTQAPVLILDDCTSALDAVTESKVREGLKTLGGKTTLMITQRISTAMAADKILVLDNGENAGCGTHEELIASCMVYQEIFNSQIGDDEI